MNWYLNCVLLFELYIEDLDLYRLVHIVFFCCFCFFIYIVHVACSFMSLCSKPFSVKGSKACGADCKAHRGKVHLSHFVMLIW